ncbi:MAG: hypothetical protein ACRDNB_11645 [Gaiellaceae bacterium]
MRGGEEPGFRPDGDAFTVVGVDAFAEHARLSRAEVQQLRKNGTPRTVKRRIFVLGKSARIVRVRLVSEGDVPFVNALSTGARAIYKRTGGDCP